MELGDGFLDIIRYDRFEDPRKLTNTPTTWYPRLFGARLKYSSIFIVHPTPKFSGGCADVGVRGGTMVRRNNVVLNISDKEKQVLFKIEFKGMLSVNV